MAKYRQSLPQLSGDLFLTDGGIETTLIFHEGLELPYFAAFCLLKDEPGTAALRRYYRTYAAIAKDHGVGFVLESATWRANPDWGDKLGYTRETLADVNRKAIDLVNDIREELESAGTPMVISGCLGPRGDGYSPVETMDERESEKYHRAQIRTLSETNADIVTAITMTYAEEAIGICRAAESAGMPAAVSFTVETDGRLPSGQTLKDAVETVDRTTGKTPAYYMINCAHPTHFKDALTSGEPWVARIRGIRANASTKSHAELDEAKELDEGDPVELARHYKGLRERFKHFDVLGGCCGTDHRHVEEICKACVATAGH